MMQEQLPMVGGEMPEALEREKRQFLKRNTGRCSHLLVRYRREATTDRLVITANFTLDEARLWQRAEATLPLEGPTGVVGCEPRVVEAFGSLDEAIAMARIARLFAPLSVASRMAAGRNGRAFTPL